MAEPLFIDLPRDLPSFLERFVTDVTVPGLSGRGTLAGRLSLRGLQP